MLEIISLINKAIKKNMSELNSVVKKNSNLNITSIGDIKKKCKNNDIPVQFLYKYIILLI
jgi:hypothetical protein